MIPFVFFSKNILIKLPATIFFSVKGPSGSLCHGAVARTRDRAKVVRLIIQDVVAPKVLAAHQHVINNHTQMDLQLMLALCIGILANLPIDVWIRTSALGNNILHHDIEGAC